MKARRNRLKRQRRSARALLNKHAYLALHKAQRTSYYFEVLRYLPQLSTLP